MNNKATNKRLFLTHAEVCKNYEKFSDTDEK